MDETKTAKNDLASLLRDFAQGASNSAATNVAIPVDAIAWLLRKSGVNVPPNPVMGSDWMAEKGLTREPKNKLAGLVGDMAGMVAPFAAAAKAPQIAKGLLAAGEAMPMGSKSVQSMSKASPMADRGAIFTSATGKVPQELLDKRLKGFGNLPESDLYDAAGGLRSDMQKNIYKLDDGNYLGVQDPFWKSKDKPMYVHGDNLDEVIASINNRAIKSQKAVSTAEKIKYDNSLEGLLEKEFGKDAFSFNKSARSKSSYVTHNATGEKIRISDHDLPLHYVSSDLDIPLGLNSKEIFEQIKKHIRPNELNSGNERLLKILERNGESITPKFPQSEAIDLAQKRAALPISENGLGLPANNTAMDRANAMFPTEAYHGTNVPIEKIDPSMFGSSTGANSAKQGFWAVDNPTVAGGYAEYAANEAPIKKILQEADFQEKVAQRTGNWDKYDSLVAKAEELESANYANPLKGQNIMPLRLNAQNSSVMDAGGNSFVGAENDINRFLKQSKFNGKDVAEIKNLDDAVGRVDLPANHYAIFNPDNIRSRFAAFDPWRRNAAIAASMGVAAPDLLANPLGDKNNRLIDILRSK